jgi:hypothetical protein
MRNEVLDITSMQLLRVVARRWYVVLAVLLISGVCAVLVARLPGVYSAQASVRLLPPPALTEGTNAIGERAEGLVAFAALVEKQFNGNSAELEFASPNATLSGAGLRSGVSVRLVNVGSQWNLIYRDPVLIVDVVEPDAADARAMLNETVAELVRIVDERQDGTGVSPDSRVGVLVSPDPVAVDYVTGSRLRSVVATLLLGLSAAVLSALAVDKVFRGRRAHQPTA